MEFLFDRIEGPCHFVSIIQQLVLTLVTGPAAAILHQHPSVRTMRTIRPNDTRQTDTLAVTRVASHAKRVFLVAETS